jgi:Tfp pilus assembly protein PilF
MNLLLDALRPTESNPSASREPEEEPLDGVEILKMLSEKAPVSSALTLEASPVDVAVTAPVASPEVAVVPPRETATALRQPAIAPIELASRAPPASATALPPVATSPARKYAVMLAAAVAVVIIVLFGKSILYPGTSPSTSPDTDDSPPTVTNTTAPPSTGPVQVPTRPASQFAYTGGAPEIDLREDPIVPSAIHAASGPARPVVSADTPETAVAAAAPTSALASSLRTLTVTPSTGLSPIDRHVEAGYRALATGNLSNARREYLAALELDPKNVDALMGTASVAARDGNATVATAAYAKVLSLEPGNADATAALAILNHEHPPVEAGESRLKTMIASDVERRPALHSALAGVYAADARWADAAQEYFIALSLDPSNSDLAFNVAASLDQNHKAAAALTYYMQALALAKLRPAQIDVHAIEERIGKLQARIEAKPAAPQATP